MDEGEFLKAFGADIFFDDQQSHCESARQHVATGHVPYGVANGVVGVARLAVQGFPRDNGHTNFASLYGV